MLGTLALAITTAATTWFKQISDLFNLVDVESRGTGVSPASKTAGIQAPLKSGGFDLVYHNGFVETDPKVTVHNDICDVDYAAPRDIMHVSERHHCTVAIIALQLLVMCISSRQLAQCLSAVYSQLFSLML
jgi:hypothetical protein